MVDRELKKGARATNKAGSTIRKIVPKGSVQFTGSGYDQLAQTLDSAGRVLTFNDPIGALEDAWNYGENVRLKRLQDIVESKTKNRMTFGKYVPISESKSLDRQIARGIVYARKMEPELQRIVEQKRVDQAVADYIKRKYASPSRSTRRKSGSAQYYRGSTGYKGNRKSYAKKYKRTGTAYSAGYRSGKSRYRGQRGSTGSIRSTRY